MNTLADLTQIWIGELSRFMEMFSAWFNNSLLSGLTVKRESLVGFPNLYVTKFLFCLGVERCTRRL